MASPTWSFQCALSLNQSSTSFHVSITVQNSMFMPPFSRSSPFNIESAAVSALIDASLNLPTTSLRHPLMLQPHRSPKACAYMWFSPYKTRIFPSLSCPHPNSTIHFLRIVSPQRYSCRKWTLTTTQAKAHKVVDITRTMSNIKKPTSWTVRRKNLSARKTFSHDAIVLMLATMSPMRSSMSPAHFTFPSLPSTSRCASKSLPSAISSSDRSQSI